MFMKVFYEFTLPSKRNDQLLILSSLIKDHLINCKDSECFCK